ncbi:MAG: transporter substrate-binding domain-containing protein, partial [Sulfurimonas sp.]|nr:transporter substrate-binding domain-containing protein [Sulfurimonas sp.]
MKRILLIITLFISITSAKTITIASDMWCPYNCSPKSKQPGYIIEVAKAVFEPLGYKVIYKLMPWSRALKMTEYGKINAVAGALKSDAPSFIYTKNSLGIGRIAFCKLNDNKWDYKDINSLNSEKLGIVKDYSYGDSIDNYINKQSDNTNKILTLT